FIMFLSIFHYFFPYSYFFFSFTLSSSLPLSFFYSSRDHRDLHSFPTRRSSDLANLNPPSPAAHSVCSAFAFPQPASKRVVGTIIDRKSTRLNSSHVAISYAVFCLKKKKKKK